MRASPRPAVPTRPAERLLIRGHPCLRGRGSGHAAPAWGCCVRACRCNSRARPPLTHGLDVCSLRAERVSPMPPVHPHVDFDQSGPPLGGRRTFLMWPGESVLEQWDFYDGYFSRWRVCTPRATRAGLLVQLAVVRWACPRTLFVCLFVVAFLPFLPLSSLSSFTLASDDARSSDRYQLLPRPTRRAPQAACAQADSAAHASPDSSLRDRLSALLRFRLL